ncbi:hypothetical protein [Actinosynnema sp. NPDC023587]|uniref:hypothetical protein n=1 Tax=Actinosynnema sp. NPDC023587 TaxID=3154695 RepID=UPI0033E6095E
MNQRIAAALIGTTMGLATFAGSTLMASANAPEPTELQQDQVSEVICDMLEELDLLDHPELADLVEKLGCEDDDDDTTTTPTSTTTTSTSAPDPGRR